MPAVLLIVACVAGCGRVSTLKNEAGDNPMGSPQTTVDHAAASSDRTMSLSAIVNDDLQRGRYAEGERALRHYLAAHPDEKQAQALLRQLTVDPAKELGTRSRNYVVQPGDSYSTLAARYLGDSQRFLVLARYNGSTDPSKLRVGQTLRLPLAASAGSPSDARTAVADSAKVVSNNGASAAADSGTVQNLPGGSAATKARRLQRESVASLEQGHKDQALMQLDEALSLDPHLKPSDPQAAALRQQLLAAYHQRAIVLYRDQKLDPAIALWDHILAIDPAYEPAVVYRARALELKQRLQQF